MRINKHDIPTVIDAPGAVARQIEGFGEAAEPMAGEYFCSVPAPTSPRCYTDCPVTIAPHRTGATCCRASS